MAGEKKYDPTPKRRRKAREDGDVAKSATLGAAMILAGGLSLILVGYRFALQAVPLAGKSFSLPADLTQQYMLEFAGIWAIFLLRGIGSFLLLVFLLSLLAEVLQVGVHVSFKALGLKFDRLNLIKGLKKLLGIDEKQQNSGLPMALIVELAKNTGYIVVLGSTLSMLVLVLAKELVQSGGLGTREVGEVVWLSSSVLAFASVLFLACTGILDLLYQKRRQLQRLRMDAQEFKREFRESEGDPEQRSMRKQLHHELMLHSIEQGVRNSRVVVVSDSSSKR